LSKIGGAGRSPAKANQRRNIVAEFVQVTADPAVARSLVKVLMASARARQANTIDLLEAYLRVVGWVLGKSPAGSNCTRRSLRSLSVK
jgi:hypothetical protein